MIQNDQQLAHTKAWIARFSEAIARAETAPVRHPDPRMRTIVREALVCQVEDLKAQADAYETGASLDHDPTSSVNLGAMQADDSHEGIIERTALLELQVLKMQQEIEALRALALLDEWAGASRDTPTTASTPR